MSAGSQAGCPGAGAGCRSQPAPCFFIPVIQHEGWSQAVLGPGPPGTPAGSALAPDSSLGGAGPSEAGERVGWRRRGSGRDFTEFPLGGDMRPARRDLAWRAHLPLPLTP